MKIEMWDIGRVKPYEKNPRKNEGAIDAVAKSIREFGFRVPIVVDGDGVIIAGHTRLKAAEKLGLAEVPVDVARELTPDQVKALRIADNKRHELSSWDMELLPIELADLQGADFDLSLLGFSAEDITALLAPAGTTGLTDPDEVPAPPDAATTAPGDIWVLGNHRLMCGDSSKPEDLDRLLAGAQIHLVPRASRRSLAARICNASDRRASAARRIESGSRGRCITSRWTWRGTLRRPSRRPRRCGRRTALWPTTSSPTRSSTGCSRRGSGTSPAC